MIHLAMSILNIGVINSLTLLSILSFRDSLSLTLGILGTLGIPWGNLIFTQKVLAIKKQKNNF